MSREPPLRGSWHLRCRHSITCPNAALWHPDAMHVQTVEQHKDYPCHATCRLRFSVAFWHTFTGDGSDPFGSPTKVRRAPHSTSPACFAAHQLSLPPACQHQGKAVHKPGSTVHRTYLSLVFCSCLTSCDHVLQAWPWHVEGLSPLERAYRAMHANFEFMDKLGIELWCFHDRWVTCCA